MYHKKTAWNWMHSLPNMAESMASHTPTFKIPIDQILAISLQPFPAELKESAGAADQVPSKREQQGSAGSQFTRPGSLLDGQTGTIHVAV
jgi:hypothetical protein